MAADAVKADAEGRPLLTLEVTWDGASYAVKINGSAAPQAVIDWMNQKWAVTIAKHTSVSFFTTPTRMVR